VAFAGARAKAYNRVYALPRPIVSRATRSCAYRERREYLDTSARNKQE
jgi:hypothetical protein